MSVGIIPDIDSTMSETLYNAEQKKKSFFKKQGIRILYIGLIALFTFLFCYYLMFLSESYLLLKNQRLIIIIIAGLFMVGVNIYFIYNNHQLYHRNFEQEVILNFIEQLYPKATYDAKGGIDPVTIGKAPRYQDRPFEITKYRDFIRIPMRKLRIEFLEIDSKYGRGTEPIKFEGIFILIRPYKNYWNLELERIVNSDVFKEQLKKLNNFWNSYPQYLVHENGDIAIDIYAKNSQFLEAPRRLKIYSQEYLRGLYQEVQLIAELGKIVDEYLVNS